MTDDSNNLYVEMEFKNNVKNTHFLFESLILFYLILASFKIPCIFFFLLWKPHDCFWENGQTSAEERNCEISYFLTPF